MMPYKAQVSNTSRLGATRIADPVGCESSVAAGAASVAQCMDSKRPLKGRKGSGVLAVKL